MPQGLQVFDSTGEVSFDSSYGVSRILGSVFVSGWMGFVNIPFAGTGSTKFAFWASNNFGNIAGSGTWPKLWVSGNTVLNWDALYITSETPEAGIREVIICEATR